MHGQRVPAWSELVGLVGDELRERAVSLSLRAAPDVDTVLFARFDRRAGGFLGVVASGRAVEGGPSAPPPAAGADAERIAELVHERSPWHGPGFDEIERGAWDGPRREGRCFTALPIASRGSRPYPLGSLCVIGPVEVDVPTTQALVEIALALAVAVEVGDREHDAVARARDMEATVRNLRASAQIARAVAAESDIGSLLELIVDQGRTLTRARGMLAQIQRDGRLEVAAQAGVMTVEERSAEAPASYSAPMVFRGERLGMLSAFAGDVPAAASLLGVGAAPPEHGHPLVDAAPRALGAEAEQLLRAFAASAATAVATARTVADSRLRSTVRAAERERRSWARELHDETLQGLAAVRLLLETGLAAPTDEGRSEAVAHAVRRLGEETTRLRGLITDLRPAVLDQLGLEPALRALRDRTATDHGLVAALNVELGDAPRSTELETVAYRIVQEALTNVARHAHARRTSVGVLAEDGALVVTVSDDGAGFDPEEVDATQRFGLLGMRERAQLLGGSLVVESRPGEGATVRSRLPLDGEPAVAHA